MTRRHASPTDRPRRGTPADTRARLVAAAARVFNRDGFHGTDSNRIARAAGYAPGSFYKHFADKRAIFLEAWEAWVTAEWAAVETALAAGGDAAAVATRIVAVVLALPPPLARLPREHARARGDATPWRAASIAASGRASSGSCAGSTRGAA